MARIFISYRREDAQYQADRLHALIQPRVANPREDIFIDVDNIPFGVDFEQHIADKVSKCDVLLAVIGANWLNCRDTKTGQRRLDDPTDFVRIEIVTALERGIRVVPILLDGTLMPNADQLPDSLKLLEKRNAALINRRSFEADVERLMKGIGISGPMRDPTDSSANYKVGSRMFTWQPGEVFYDPLTDGGKGPEMVVLPAGSFKIGSPSTEQGRQYNEGPQRSVQIGYQFAAGKYLVTWTQYATFMSAVSSHAVDHDGFGQGDRPVTNVSWQDAQGYVRWLSGMAGQEYRLLSESEWEYAARAGTTTPYAFGVTISGSQANFSENSNNSQAPAKTTPVGTFPANAFGLFDMHGNVSEWVEDCYESEYSFQPTDGSAHSKESCADRVIRGGSWGSSSQFLRSACRHGVHPSTRLTSLGFRVAKTLP